jgi:glycosyltransferase involved in cell wall biosynthesis
MPVYNGGDFLATAIKTVLEQSFTNFEFIIIDDCSADESQKVIRSFNDHRIRLHIHKENGGVVAAMNTGLMLASAPYVAVMHADDIAYPHRLQLQKDWMDKNQDTALVAGFIEFINREGHVTGKWELDRKKHSRKSIRSCMPRENCIAHSSVMMRSSIVKNYGYDTGQQKKGYAVEDYPLWLNLLADGHHIDKINQPVLGYRTHEQSATTQYLRTQNPYFINYYTKKTYLRQRKRKGYTAFDYLVFTTMQLDFIKAHIKMVKRFVLNGKHV